MTPAEEEARFISLWQAGVETAAIACQLGLTATAAQARARRLQRRGLLQPRPRGGAYPSQKAQARPEGAPAPPPAQRPVQTLDTDAVSSVDTGAVQRLDRLEDEVQGLRLLLQSVIDRLDHPQCRHRCRPRPCPPIPRGRPSAGTCGSSTPSGRSSPPGLQSGRCPRANWCRSCYGRH
jgi:hypothetical protein